MKITKHRKALLGFAASTLLVLGGCTPDSMGDSAGTADDNFVETVYGIPNDVWEEMNNYDYENPYESAPIPDDYKEQFYISEIPDEMYERDEAVYTDENCPVKREDLRYLHVLNKNWDGETLEGELIVNKHIAEDVLDILLKLYEADYRIGEIGIVNNSIVKEDYYVCEQSILYNISMCFRTYSLVNHESKHGLGLALDINPVVNPYTENGEVPQTLLYMFEHYPPERDSNYRYMIREDDLCVQLFKEHGFEWGGDWDDPKNYMHFEIPDEMVEQWYPGTLKED